VFELISLMVYYLQVMSRAPPHQLSVSLFFESDAVSAIGFVCLASSGIDLIVNGFPTFQIIEWSAWLSNIKRGS